MDDLIRREDAIAIVNDRHRFPSRWDVYDYLKDGLPSVKFEVEPHDRWIAVSDIKAEQKKYCYMCSDGEETLNCSTCFVKDFTSAVINHPDAVIEAEGE